MRRVARMLVVVAALAGPTVLAFFSGGYFDTPRLVAAVVAWSCVLAAALFAPRPLPSTRAARVAIAALLLLTAWTALSSAWAPLSDPAANALERLLLYLATLVAAAAFLRGGGVRALGEPALAAGTVIVVGYGLAGRLLPDVIQEARSLSAGGRLEQPLTYWNAMGALAAIGIVLSVRVAGDVTRSRPLRAAAAAGSVPLAVGAYLSFSRGALAALALGIVTLIALAPTRAQLRAVALCAVAGVGAAGLAGALTSVRTLTGSLAAREQQGAAMLGALGGIAALAAAGQWYVARRETDGRWSTGALPRVRHAQPVAAALVIVLFAGLVAYAASDKGARKPVTGANPARLGSLQSNRYAYWSIALRDGFLKRPLSGVGAGGFAVVWLQHRHINERTRVAHSLYIETLAELGLIGFALLVAFYAGIAAVIRCARGANAVATTGAAAAVVTYAAHAAVDWDWEMPALTLVALVLAGLLIGAAEDSSRPDDAAGPASVDRLAEGAAA